MKKQMFFKLERLKIKKNMSVEEISKSKDHIGLITGSVIRFSGFLSHIVDPFIP